ncbi:hypothetical protein EV361DRAFT_954631 [Lentinula raphanica]|nr:hypothetical protein EV361DRAFT_954631 [Lentinula raphanica]
MKFRSNLIGLTLISANSAFPAPADCKAAAASTHPDTSFFDDEWNDRPHDAHLNRDPSMRHRLPEDDAGERTEDVVPSTPPFCSSQLMLPNSWSLWSSLVVLYSSLDVLHSIFLCLPDECVHILVLKAKLVLAFSRCSQTRHPAVSPGGKLLELGPSTVLVADSSPI